MRKTAEQKAATRQRIIAAASGLFRRHGIDAVGVDAVMHEAGLTHGGFYGYFASKEALVAEVSAASLARSAARWDAITQEAPPEEALRRIAGAYLDPAHVAAPERGCVLTTLGSEMARHRQARPAVTGAIRRMVQTLQRCLPGHPPDAAVAALAEMVGAVMLARLSDDPQLADAFLRAARRAVAGGCRTDEPLPS